MLGVQGKVAGASHSRVNNPTLRLPRATLTFNERVIEGALDVRVAVSGKLLDGGVQEVHGPRLPRKSSWLGVDPVLLAQDAGVTPDQWQADLLRNTSKRVLMLCSRQSGKSETAVLQALWSVPAPSHASPDLGRWKG